MLRWWQWFQNCEDNLGLCETRTGETRAFTEQQVTEALNNENEVSFSIVRTDRISEIPTNYYCQWEVKIDKESEYQLSIKREFFPVLEQMELNIIGENK